MSKSSLEKLRQFLQKDERELVKKRKKLHKIIKSMHQRQKKLKEELRHTKNAEGREKLQNQIVLLKEQRKKGLAILTELRKKAQQNGGNISP
jgi:hypothetical protein